MEKVAAVVAKKQNKIEELAKEKVEKEQEKNACEVKIEDIKDLIEKAEAELRNLIETVNVSQVKTDELNELFIKFLVVFIVSIILALSMSPWLIAIVVTFVVLKTPIFLKLLKEKRSYDKLSLAKSIKDKKDTLNALEKDKDKLIAVLRTIEYSLIDIDNERKVTEDTLNFILNSKSFTESENIDLPEKETVKTRIRTAI